jgi:hypothetical protein
MNRKYIISTSVVSNALNEIEYDWADTDFLADAHTFALQVLNRYTTCEMQDVDCNMLGDGSFSMTSPNGEYHVFYNVHETRESYRKEVAHRVVHTDFDKFAGEVRNAAEDYLSNLTCVGDFPSWEAFVEAVESIEIEWIEGCAYDAGYAPIYEIFAGCEYRFYMDAARRECPYAEKIFREVCRDVYEVELHKYIDGLSLDQYIVGVNETYDYLEYEERFCTVQDGIYGWQSEWFEGFETEDWYDFGKEVGRRYQFRDNKKLVMWIGCDGGLEVADEEMFRRDYRSEFVSHLRKNGAEL